VLFAVDGGLIGRYDMRRLYAFKEDLSSLHALFGAERDALVAMGRQDLLPFTGSAALGLRDLHARLVQAAATVELYQEFLTNALQSYQSQVDVNLNVVMKALTAITVLHRQHHHIRVVVVRQLPPRAEYRG